MNHTTELELVIRHNDTVIATGEVDMTIQVRPDHGTNPTTWTPVLTDLPARLNAAIRAFEETLNEKEAR